MKINKNDTIITPDGPGIAVAFEEFRQCKRIGVRLENNPYDFPVAFYFDHEIKKEKNDVH